MKTAQRRSSLPSSQLIHTKIQAPQVGAGQIARPALYDRFLDASRRADLLTVVGAAGSGKSSLLSELGESAERIGLHCCWLSLDRDDDEPATFATYFVGALEPLDRSSALRELSLLRSNPVRDFHAFFHSLVARVSGIRKDTLLIVDDFQHLRNPLIIDFWNRLIAHAPSTLKIAIASRLELGLDVARKRVAGSLVEIQQDRLNFDRSQADLLFKQVHGVNLDEAALAALIETTEGWAAGLQLVALALDRNRSGPKPLDLISGFTGKDKDLTAYLVESVLNAQTEQTRTFLLRTSPLVRISPGLCEAVTGVANGAEILEELVRSNLFLIPLDRERTWYRYHHLFAEFLQNELRRSDAHEHQRVCEIAAEWCDSQGMVTEAIQYALTAERYDIATRLIASRAREVAQLQGDHYTVLDWMRRLPDSYHSRHPQILLAHAWSRAFSRDTARAMELAQLALTGLDSGDLRWDLPQAEELGLRRLAMVVQAIAIGCSDDLKSGLRACEALLADIPETEAFLTASIQVTVSYCRHANGDLASSVAASNQAYKCGHRAGSLYAIVWADFMHVLSSVASGNLDLAGFHADRSWRNANEASEIHSYPLSLSALSRAEVAAARCDFKLVEEVLSVSRAFTSVFGPLEPLLVAMRLESRTHAWNGALGEARAILAQGRDMALSSHQPRLYLALAAEEIDLLIRVNDLSPIEEVVNSTQLLSGSNPFSTQATRQVLQEVLSLSRARILMAAEDFKPAIDQLAKVARLAANAGRLQQSLSARSLRAVALWRDGRSIEACKELDRAISIGADHGNAYALLAGGPEISKVLAAIEQRREKSNEATDSKDRKIVLRNRLSSLLLGDSVNVEDEGGTRQTSQGASKLLTRREIEILRLVSAGRQTRQLASELFISEATAKWHLHNIFEKFGVRNRSAAAAAARDLGLI